jgi:hypothetical protein
LDTERPLAFRKNHRSPPFGEASPEVRSLRLEVRTDDEVLSLWVVVLDLPLKYSAEKTRLAALAANLLRQIA